MNNSPYSSTHNSHNMVEFGLQIPWIASSQGLITDISNRFQKITEKMKGLPLGDGWINIFHPDDRPLITERWQNSLKTGLPLDIEIRFCHAKRKCHWMRIRAVPNMTADGKILCWYGIAEDIHGQKMLEQKLKKANRRLKIQALTDSLTRLPNRRELKRILAQEYMRTRRSGNFLTVLMIDIDYFKNFNDHYGHVSGDSCLQLVARTLQKSLKRPADAVGRYGGEEFVAILPGTDQEGASLVANNIMTAIRSTGIEHAKSKFGKVTICIGIAVYDPLKHLTITGPSEIILAADEALYYAKKHGRDRFHIFELT